jgi:hypothetical protein
MQFKISRGLQGCLAAVLVATASTAAANPDPIPAEMEAMYTRALRYLAGTQGLTGAWEDRQAGGQNFAAQPGVVGLAVLAFLAHGEDTTSGPYRDIIVRGLKFILQNQDARTGYIGTTMYNHGFATLALAEAYGAVEMPELGPALNKAVQLILTSQKQNPLSAWRYNAGSRDGDTTVSGAQVVALYAARNAGIPVPDSAFDRALKFFQTCQSRDGGFGYTPGSQGTSEPRTAIGTLVFALAKEKKSPTFAAAQRRLGQAQINQNNYYHYFIYYAAQALFHADMKAWETWNAVHSRRLVRTQNPDGSWSGQRGTTFSTSMALLSLALNYRFLPIYER